MKRHHRFITLIIFFLVLLIVPGTVVSAKSVKKYQLSFTSITLKKGHSKTLKVIGKKGRTTFKSSNTNVAKVSSKGKITALRPGKATITAKRNGKKLKCKVTVPVVYYSGYEPIYNFGAHFNRKAKHTDYSNSSGDSYISYSDSYTYKKATKKEAKKYCDMIYKLPGFYESDEYNSSSSFSRTYTCQKQHSVYEYEYGEGYYNTYYEQLSVTIGWYKYLNQVDIYLHYSYY